jgi:hypothetical protein
MKTGVWCINCEHVTLTEDLEADEYGGQFCSICDAGDWDLFDVRGTSFITGTQVGTGSDELEAIRYYPDEES